MTRWATKDLMKTILQIRNSCDKEWKKSTNKCDGSFYICQEDNSKTVEFIKTVTRKYEKIVHFDVCEIRLILLLFREMVGGCMGNLLPEEDLKAFISEQFDITNPKSLEGLIRAFKSKSRVKDINAEEFLVGLSIFLRGTLLERAKFTFKAFDVDSDGYLRKKDEFAKYFQDAFDPNSEAVETEFDCDEPARETSNFLWSKFIVASEKADIDVPTFTRLCLKEPMLMECLAPVYPNDRKIITFQNLLFCKVYAPSYLNLPEVQKL